MNNQTCGYQGHFCNRGVQFISRYREENSYCVAGQRISVHDNGTVHATCAVITEAQLNAIKLYELQKYAEYVQWHVERNAASKPEWRMGLQPFTFPWQLQVA